MHLSSPSSGAVSGVGAVSGAGAVSDAGAIWRGGTGGEAEAREGT